jgi:glucose-1-phosphate thymidylyltransferase
VKGIVLAGGTATRLRPITLGVSKQLLPVYDKPLVYYPLSTLMLAGIRDVLVISTRSTVPALEALLGDGSHLGIRISYAVQDEPRGIADGFVVGASHVGDDSVAMVLGDNVFHGPGFSSLLQREVAALDGATLFGYPVADPDRFGVGETDEHGRLVSIEEKPARPRSNRAITGLYLYDNSVLEIVAGLRPSARGELEISDVNRAYLEQGRARLVDLGRGFAWLDTGTGDALLEAGQFVQTLGSMQGVNVACLEEVALRMGFIDHEACFRLGEALATTAYGRYIMQVAKQEPRRVAS